MGYDLKKFTHEYVSFAVDFILLVILILVVKPTALVLIYIELFLRLLFLSLGTFFHSVKEVLPRALIKKLVIRPYMNIMFYFTGGLVPIRHVHHQHHVDADRVKVMRDLWECVMCVGSLSLLMKFFSRGPSTVESTQHKKLARNSLLYRIFHHAI